ncbi:hypothetical protein HYV89_05465 [Candidatus Woesearchaeota archaeon]|nr:hypothetical protein [Candidatus Woesearchaeota archaeon]
MDKIRLSKNKKTRRVDIFINGKSLINILRKVEISQIEKDNEKERNNKKDSEYKYIKQYLSPETMEKLTKRNNEKTPKSLAGSYTGLPPKRVFLPSKHFLGKQSKRWYYRNNKTCILVCSCGGAGCWPMITKITLTPKKVIWNNFEQAHNSRWKYNLKFNFDRKQYESELSKRNA